jgi:hypothetical protein
MPVGVAGVCREAPPIRIRIQPLNEFFWTDSLNLFGTNTSTFYNHARVLLKSEVGASKIYFDRIHSNSCIIRNLDNPVNAPFPRSHWIIRVSVIDDSLPTEIDSRVKITKNFFVAFVGA